MVIRTRKVLFAAALAVLSTQAGEACAQAAGDAVRHAGATAESLGLEMTIFASPGGVW